MHLIGGAHDGAHTGLRMMETLFIVGARGHGGHDDTLAHLCWSLVDDVHGAPCEALAHVLVALGTLTKP